MTPPRIVFRADASHAIGFGHVARLSAVIEELARTGAEPVVMFGGDAALAGWTERHGLRAEVRSWTTDDLVTAAAEPGVRAVVIDGPALATELVPHLAERQIRTVAIDDRGDCPLALDAVVNHNFHAPALAATYPAARLRLLGRNYLMLRRAIRRFTRSACRPATPARLRVVITFGGSDPVGATVRTLRLLPPGRGCDVVVIAGPGFRDDQALAAAAVVATVAGHDIEIVRDPADPAALFVAADAAICSAGGTLGELAYLGCPALGFAIVADQVATARAQADAGLIASGRSFVTLDDDTLRTQLFSFLHDDRGRLDQRQRALATTDGDGARRIVAEALS
jgi:spore coat polysaccharide biosynthesis predicted glycosyltransferase SpsG